MTANALEHLMDQLRQRNCICGIAPGASTAMHMGHFTWNTPGIPKNFTIFALPQRKTDTLDAVGLAVKAVEGKGLEVLDTKSLAKLHFQAPVSLNSARHMLNNLVALCVELT
eukprot:12283876-Ditylum_brightwellii.AAC.1